MNSSPSGQLARAVVLLLTTVLCWSSATQPWSVCQSIPLNNGQLGPIFSEVRGKVAVVALLQANGPSCVQEITRLNALRTKLHQDGMEDVEFIGINSKEWQSRLNFLQNQSTFPIFQSTHRNRLFRQLGGHKGDVLIFDRCGRMTYYVAHPKSSVQFGYVEVTIQSTYLDNPCGVCRKTAEAVHTQLKESDDGGKRVKTSLNCRCVNSEDLSRACACKTRKESCLCHHSPVDFKGRCSCNERNGNSKSCVCRHDSNSLAHLCKCSLISCPNETSSYQDGQVKISTVSGSSEPSLFDRFKSFLYTKFTDFYNIFTGKESEPNTS